MSIIKEIRELTGLSHEKLAAWLRVSKSLVQFAELGERSLQGDASKKLIFLASTIQQLKNASKTGQHTLTYNKPAAFALKHKKKMNHHRDLADKLQQQVNKLMLQHAKLTTRFALLDEMKNINTELYSSTETDKHIAGLLDSFGRDDMKALSQKLELLQDRIAIHRGYGEVHKRRWEQFGQMDK